MEITVSKTSDEVGEKIWEVVQKHKKKKWLSHKNYVEDVQKNQVPLFKISPSDLNPDLDIWYPNQNYERKTINGISYIMPNCDWVRIHLNTDRFIEKRPWISKAAIAYHGSSHEGRFTYSSVKPTYSIGTSGRIHQI